MMIKSTIAVIFSVLLSSCVMTDVLVEKNIYVENSEQVEVDYTTASDIDADLRQDLKDLLDLEIPLIP